MLQHVADHCVVQGLYVPQGEVWQPAGKCAEMTCEGMNVTSTKGWVRYVKCVEDMYTVYEYAGTMYEEL